MSKGNLTTSYKPFYMDNEHLERMYVALEAANQRNIDEKFAVTKELESERAKSKKLVGALTLARNLNCEDFCSHEGKSVHGPICETFTEALKSYNEGAE